MKKKTKLLEKRESGWSRRILLKLKEEDLNNKQEPRRRNDLDRRS